MSQVLSMVKGTGARVEGKALREATDHGSVEIMMLMLGPVLMFMLMFMLMSVLMLMFWKVRNHPHFHQRDSVMQFLWNWFFLAVMMTDIFDWHLPPSFCKKTHVFPFGNAPVAEMELRWKIFAENVSEATFRKAFKCIFSQHHLHPWLAVKVAK